MAGVGWEPCGLGTNMPLRYRTLGHSGHGSWDQSQNLNPGLSSSKSSLLSIIPAASNHIREKASPAGLTTLFHRWEADGMGGELVVEVP